MLGLLTPHPTSRRAAAILRRVFGSIGGGLAFRLWDGAEVRFGESEPVCTVRISAPTTFVRLVRDPTPLNFAEAYVESAIDIEGDLFAAMNVANEMEELRLSAGERLRLLASLWKG